MQRFLPVSMVARSGGYLRFFLRFHVCGATLRKVATQPGPSHGGGPSERVFYPFPNRFRAVSIKPLGPLHPPASAGHHGLSPVNVSRYSIFFLRFRDLKGRGRSSFFYRFRSRFLSVSAGLWKARKRNKNEAKAPETETEKKTP